MHLHALATMYGTRTAVELPGDGRMMQVDKRVVKRSDRYLNNQNQRYQRRLENCKKK